MARKSKIATVAPSSGGNWTYAGRIIKLLERISTITGHRPYTIFDDFLNITWSSLEMLPKHLEARHATGELAKDPPETRAIWDQIRLRYQSSGSTTDRYMEVIDLFAQAFAELVNATSQGLNPTRPEGWGTMGPDVLGQVYELFANNDPSWNAQYFTPYTIAKFIASVTIPDGEKMVMDQIRQALEHPDNIAGRAVILAGMLLPPDDSEVALNYFLTWVVPAALPYYKPIKFLEPCIGSGVMMLAAASQFPEWAIRLGLVSWSGLDIDDQVVRVSRINARLYNLDGFLTRLEVAAEGMQQLAAVEKPVLPPLNSHKPSNGKGPSLNGTHVRPDLVDAPDYETMYRESEMVIEAVAVT